MLVKAVSALRRHGPVGFSRIVLTLLRIKLRNRSNEIVSSRRLNRAVERSKGMPNGQLNVISVSKLGYAARGLCGFMVGGSRYVASADVGDDTSTLTQIDSSCNRVVGRVKFPLMSAPIGVCTAKVRGKTHLFYILFNFDEKLEINQSSQLLRSKLPIDKFLEQIDCANRSLPSEELFDIVSERMGCWGYRAIAVAEGRETTLLAITDRDRDELYILPNAGLRGPESGYRVNLSEDKISREPVGISIIHATEKEFVLAVTFRKANAVRLIWLVDGGRRMVDQREFALPGSSRASIARGYFRNNGRIGFAIALWGGDTSDLNSPHRGSVVVFELDEAGAVCRVAEFEGGIHPTDCLAADIDGDGLDEIVVLNYGTGLNTYDPRDPGGIQVFRWNTVDERFSLVDEIDIPNPRIAIKSTWDVDKPPQVLVNLFFEGKLVGLCFGVDK